MLLTLLAGPCWEWHGDTLSMYPESGVKSDMLFADKFCSAHTAALFAAAEIASSSSPVTGMRFWVCCLSLVMSTSFSIPFTCSDERVGTALGQISSGEAGILCCQG